MRTKTKRLSSIVPDLHLEEGANADYCVVSVVSEEISLHFSRNGDQILCSNWTRHSPDAPTRASRTAFNMARALALDTMQGMREEERRRGLNPESNIIVSDSGIVECILGYWGAKYSFICKRDDALSWDTVALKGVTYEGIKPYLSGKEFRALKGRAFAVIKRRRENHPCYGDEGLGLPHETRQMKLAV